MYREEIYKGDRETNVVEAETIAYRMVDKKRKVG